MLQNSLASQPYFSLFLVVEAGYSWIFEVQISEVPLYSSVIPEASGYAYIVEQHRDILDSKFSYDTQWLQQCDFLFFITE